MVSLGARGALTAGLASGSVWAQWTQVTMEASLALVALHTLSPGCAVVSFETLQTRESGQAALSGVSGQSRGAGGARLSG